MSLKSEVCLALEQSAAAGRTGGNTEPPGLTRAESQILSKNPLRPSPNKFKDPISPRGTGADTKIMSLRLKMRSQ